MRGEGQRAQMHQCLSFALEQPALDRDVAKANAGTPQEELATRTLTDERNTARQAQRRKARLGRQIADLRRADAQMHGLGLLAAGPCQVTAGTADPDRSTRQDRGCALEARLDIRALMPESDKWRIRYRA